MPTTAKFELWLKPDASGLLCEPGGFHIDPLRAVDRAIITHGHSDHARPGHGAVLATPETIAVMKARLGESCAGSFQALSYGETLGLGGTSVRLAPAGHILGSAQVVIDHAGCRAVVSGDYKRRADPTTAPFELVPCDLFVTEATFGLPVFRHEPDAREIGRLLHSRRHLRRPHAPDRRLRPRQDAAADRAAARRRLRQAGLAARRAEIDVRPLRRARHRPRRHPPRRGRTRQAAGRDRHRPAVGPAGPLDAPPHRSGHRLRLGLDARARPRPPARRRAAAGHLRPLRLARADRRPSPRPAPRRSGSRTAARTRWCTRSA